MNMTREDYDRLVEVTWKANLGHAKALAEEIFSTYNLPPAALALPDLADLLSALQKASFYHGALAAYYSIEKAEEALELEELEDLGRLSKDPD
jgi:hypothetical protein